MRALVFANGEPPSSQLIAELRKDADLVVAADGGVDKALALGVVPDAVVGDFDSASDASRDVIPGEGFILAEDPDHTDLQKAVAFALQQGCHEIDVVCAGGGRADHALANLSILALSGEGTVIRVIDDLFEVTRVDSRVEIDSPVGTVISLVAIGVCTGVSTSGLRWELHDRTLAFSPLGVHNELVRTPASVTVAEGLLLLFRGRFVEKHQ